MTTHTTCTYIGTGQGCTHPALTGGNYCAEHHAVVYRAGSGRQRRRDTQQAQRVRMVQTLFYEACEELEAEGFDVYGDSEREVTVQVEDFDDR